MIPRDSFSGGSERKRVEHIAALHECLRIARDHCRCLAQIDRDAIWLQGARNFEKFDDDVKRVASRPQKGQTLLWLPQGREVGPMAEIYRRLKG